MNETSREAADGEDRDLLYKEYVRLTECCNGYVKDSLASCSWCDAWRGYAQRF
jgi:hypothetical protein